MENKDRKNNENENNLTEEQKKDAAKALESREDNLINLRNAATNNENYTNKNHSQTNAEIAEQGFTVRDGHHPNKPNPEENLDSEKSDLEGFDDFKDTNEKPKDPNEPYQNFNETEAVLKYIDDKAEEEEEFDAMEGDEHERNHSDEESKK